MNIRVKALTLVCCALCATDSLAQLISQPEPEFPASERGREGWVVLDSVLNEEGAVVDLKVKDSSGSNAFNEAALEAVREWRFEPAEGRQLSVLLNFVYEQGEVHLSKKFISDIGEVHQSIDAGKLDVARDRIDAIRSDEDLNAYELAYSLIAEGRAASVRGDKAEHLRVFRRAIINNGRWLERGKYLMLLHAIAVLEVQQKDFASALQSYDLLTATKPGRKLAKNLDEPMQSVRAFVASGADIAPPYKVADMEMTIEHEGRILMQDVGFRDDYFGETAAEDAFELPE